MKPLDCNGREIKVGDRVKIIGVEVNKFLRKWFGDNLSEEVYRDCKDTVGTAVISEYGFLIENENGDMLFDLENCDEGGDPLLEVISLQPKDF